MSGSWPSRWQRLSLAVLALVNLGESFVLLRQGSSLWLLNGALAVVCLLLLWVTLREQPRRW